MPNTKHSSEITRRKYDFRWEVLDIIVSGKSSIDSNDGFPITSLDEAGRFIASYGYDLENPIEKAEVFGHFHEALNFIRKFFLQPENPDGLRLEIPRKILELSDIRELFLMANLSMAGQQLDSQGFLLKHWACSLLKVMHTVAHIDQDIRSSYFADIQKQIFDRYYRVVQRDAEGKLFLGDSSEDPLRVNLVVFETKPKKSRNSVLLKLLHKPENVAEDIFDRVGIRFVTETRLDALRTIKYLKDKMLVMPPNIKPSRSRNTLVDLESFRKSSEVFLAKAERGELSESDLIVQLENSILQTQSSTDNPHSSRFYRSIQFTCRQLIKLKNPLHPDLKELKSISKSRTIESEDVIKILDRIDLKHIQREIRFFYPYEIQVTDRHSYEQNEKGHGSHSEYRRSQVITALKRVMGALADAQGM